MELKTGYIKFPGDLLTRYLAEPDLLNFDNVAASWALRPYPGILYII